MTWENKLISYSTLNWLWNCPESFNRQMNGEKGAKREVIKKAAEYGSAVEDIWTDIFLKRLIFKPDELESYLDFKLSDKSPEFVKKFNGGFQKCLDFFKDFCHPDYRINPQVKLKLQLGAFYLTGYIDYVLYNPDVPVILECKSTYKKDSFATASKQTKHYAYLYAKENGGIIPDTYVFYTRLGEVEKFTFTKEELVEYKNSVVTTFKDFHTRTEYPLSVNESCFVCPYSLSCKEYLKKEVSLTHDTVDLGNGTFVI